MKKLILLAIIQIASIGLINAQCYNSLLDSCYRYLALNDTTNFEKSYTRLYHAYEIESDPILMAVKTELEVMHDKDQGIRILLLDANKKGDSQTISKIRKIMKQIDMQNAACVQNIIDQHGWLGKDDIGDVANETLFLCIQHVDDRLVQEKYLPIIKNAVKEGNAEGWHFAFLTDRIRMNKGEKQIFGTQTISANGKFDYIVPLENSDSVDIYRKEIGLEPLNDYLAGAWDIEEYKKSAKDIEKRYQQWYKNRQQQNKP